jgi:hypothetical protein
MSPAAAVIVCALDLLGRSQASAPIVLLATPPVSASANAEAFVTHNPDTIYLITSTAVFQDALRDRWSGAHLDACRKIASIIVHEEWHLRYGPDERGAYLAQLMALQALQASWETIAAVRRSMAAVAHAQRASLVARTR